MKIAYLSQGTSTHTLKWVNQISKHRVEVHLITQDDIIPGFSPDVYVHKLPYSGTKGYFLNVPALKKLLKQLSPDILHSNFASGYGTLATLSGFKPHLISVWGDDIYQFPKKNQINGYLIRRNLDSASAISSTSRAMASETQLYTSKPINYCPFGIDTEAFQPRLNLKKDVGFTVGIAKHLETQYGQADLIKGFHLFLKRLPNREQRKCFLQIAGEGPSKKDYLKLTTELGIEENIKFLGQIPPAGIPSFLNNLDVFVNPSYFESFGVAILEASACGIPVVGTRVGGIPEVLDDRKTGVLIDPGNFPHLAEVLWELYCSPQLRQIFGSNGRQYVITHFEIEYCTKKMIELYRSIVNAKSAKLNP